MEAIVAPQRNEEAANAHLINLAKTKLRDQFRIPTITPFALEEGTHFCTNRTKSSTRTIPTDKLVRYVASQLQPESGCGYAVLGNFGFDRVTIPQRKFFQYVLFRRVCAMLKEETQADSEVEYRFRHFSTKDGYLPPTAKAVENDGLRWSVKNIHFDPNALILAHGYGPMKNVAGGDLLVVRINSFCHDLGLSRDKVLTTFNVAGQSYPSPRAEFHERLLAEYSQMIITSHGDPIVFLNNRVVDGVAHGVSPVMILDPSKPFQRA